jgi:uncharacterized C2H2 Zn-finger protein
MSFTITVRAAGTFGALGHITAGLDPVPKAPRLPDLWCGRCGKGFSTPGSRRRHERQSCGRVRPKKPPKTRCGRCGKVFSQPGARARHEREVCSQARLNEPPVSKCGRCGKVFNQAWARARHERNVCGRAKR